MQISQRAHGPIFKFCVVIREAILQKMAPILDPVNFFLFWTLLGHCVRQVSVQGNCQCITMDCKGVKYSIAIHCNTLEIKIEF